MAISMITGTYMPERSGTISAMMLDRREASARAPAFGWYPRASIASCTTRRVCAEIVRLPDST